MKKPTRPCATRATRQPEPRNTLPKKIRDSLSEGTEHGDNAAHLLAYHGRAFTEIETVLRLYYYAWGEVQKIQSGKKAAIEEIGQEYLPLTTEFIAEHHAALKKGVCEHASQLCGILMDAVNARDAAKIHEIGKAVEFLQTYKPAGDERRHQILAFKSCFNGKMTVRELAELLAKFGLVTKAEMEAARIDGFSALRKQCKELGFRLADSSKLRGPKRASKT